MPELHETTSPELNRSPALEDDIDFWQQRVDRLEAESASLVDGKKYPEWYYEDAGRIHAILSQLKEDGADLSNVSRCFTLVAKEAELREIITGYEPTPPIQRLACDLGDELVAKAFATEPVTGSLHTAILENIKERAASASGVLTTELNILRKAYGLETMTDLLGVKGDDYNDSLRSALLNENPLIWMRHVDQARDNDFKWADTQNAAHDWMSWALRVASGIDNSEAADYVFTASRRGEDQTFIDIVNKFDHFGVERIKKIATFTGIHGLEAYSIEQLARMETLVDNPTQAAEQLAQHDVTAVLVNRFGDHNGILKNVAADFDDENNRTLFFEITTMDDIYRRMITLQKIGVKPSSLVLAAHSGPGQFMVSDNREKDATLRRRDVATVAGRKLVQMVNSSGELNPGDYGYSMHGMKGLARLVDAYMQPSRTIDDDSSDEGRKKIIFSACHAGSEVAAGELDDNDEKIQIGLESVISQLGKDLIDTGAKTSVDIYGAPSGIQMHRSEHGIRYSGQPTSFDGDIISRPHVNAERIRVEHGTSTKQEVDEILLRKS